ncbi:MAG: beta-ketoacyl-ACP synthase 3 [Eubacteriales bacterium]|nr:beta-ketoacyl-ACP synthase 3 [Eubacteriales bacterium]
MSQLALYKTGAALPVRCLDNHFFENYLETSDEWIRERTGIETRYHAREESLLELSLQAAKAAVAELTQAEVDRIELVIVASMSSEETMPAIAPLLQAELGLSHSVLAFDLNAACSGYLYALEIARHYLTKEGLALILGAEKLSSLLDLSDRNTAVLFGDAAAANLWGLNTGGQSSFQAYCESSPDLLFAPKNGPIQMSGRAVFHFAVTNLRQEIEKNLAKVEMKASDIDLYILHQANLRILKSTAKQLKLDFTKFAHNLEHYGNTSAASIPLLIHELNQQGQLEGKKNLLIAGFGAGLTAGNLILKGHQKYVAQ